MATMDYIYGAYGQLADSVTQSTVVSSTKAVIFGTAPVHLIRNSSALVNTPIVVNGMSDAKRKIGYSEEWDKYTLCEQLAANFDNKLGNVGPLYLVNVLNPAVHSSDSPTTVDLTFVNNKATIASSDIIVDTLALEGMAYDKDYITDYDYTKGQLIITYVGSNMPTSPVSASYSTVDPSAVTEDDVIGGVTSGGEYAGIGVLKLVNQELDVVPNLLAAPGWSHIPKVYNALVTAADRINGHWYAFVVADIPVETKNAESEVQRIDTIDAAKAWQTANGYDSERSRISWPMGEDNVGRKYHLSSQTVAAFMREDAKNGGVPMRTVGNIQIPVTKLYFGEGSRNRGYDQETATELDKVGICTAIKLNGKWVLWGDHTAAYRHGLNNDARSIFDTSMRVLYHILNSFQLDWGTRIDSTMDPGLKDTIRVREQEKLDILKTKGVLIGNPKVEFLEASNPTENLMNGWFCWDLAATPTPPLKGALLRAAYTDEGFSAYFTSGSAEANSVDALL